MSKMWNCVKNVKKHDIPKPDLNRSQFSLVSSSDINPSAVELWLSLPDEVKKDPEWAPFKNYYEQEIGTPNSPIDQNDKRHETSLLLHAVKPAPVIKINNMLSINTASTDDIEQETKTSDINAIQAEGPDTKPSFMKNLPAGILKFAKARHIIKITSLVAVWLFFTVIFLSFNEKEQIIRQSSIGPSEEKFFPIPSSNDIKSISLSLIGPFLSDVMETQLNHTQKQNTPKMYAWYELHTTSDGNIHSNVTLLSNKWEILLSEEDPDFSVGEERTFDLKINSNASFSKPPTNYVLRLNTTSNKAVPFSLKYDENPLDSNTGIICACILLIGLYVLIIFEMINRCMAAIVLSLCSLAVLALVGQRPSLMEVVSWLDIETLLLLFGMMLLVAIIAETGLFDYLAVFTFEKTKGKIWPLINLLCIITALVSTFLDNVTTVLLMTPITIRLCEVMQLDPVPVLMSMAIFSNIGGSATPVGDPPNVMIASNKEVIAAGINFTEFTLHMTLGIIFVCVQSFLQLRYISYRDINKLRLSIPADIQELKQQIVIWRRAANSLQHLSKEGNVVKERLEKKVRKLSSQLETRIKENKKRACHDSTFNSMLTDMKQKYRIKDKCLLIKATIATLFVIIFYFLHAVPLFNRISLGWTALLGAVLLLLLADREDIEPVLHRVEWSTLLFFAALFVFMEALTKLGLINYIGNLTESVILLVDENARLAVALVLIVWVSGVTSAFVDNIPLTTMMVRIVTSLGSNPALGLPLAPLVFALSFGVCLGGNGTLIGASANVICAGVAEQHGYKITFKQFFLLGFPLMIGHLIVATAYLLICHCLFSWH